MNARSGHVPGVILVEGLPGTGKSTTAQWLCHLLDAQGVQARWHHEQDVSHPVYRHDELLRATQAGPAACATYHAQARARWHDVAAAAVADGTVAIFDSSFLQAPIASMQLAGCDTATMSRHVSDAASAIAPAGPALIVLRHGDTSALYHEARARRGPGFETFMAEFVVGARADDADATAPTAAILEALHAHATLVHDLAGRAGVPRVEIDVTGGQWDAYREAIAAFLDVPCLDPHGRVDDVSDFVGRYLDLDSAQELVVARDERGLFLEATGTRLLPRRDDAFELEGLSVELIFERGPGAPARMHCVARMPDIAPVWVKAT